MTCYLSNNAYFVPTCLVFAGPVTYVQYVTSYKYFMKIYCQNNVYSLEQSVLLAAFPSPDYLYKQGAMVLGEQVEGCV